MIHEHQIRVRYAETDQMGVVYYGNYAQYFEVGRVEFLRSRGYSYSELEKTGVMMPVVELQVKYKRPAKYDDLLTIKSSIGELTNNRVTFHQQVFNEQQKLLAEGAVQLAFINSTTMKAIDCPTFLFNELKKLTND